MNRLKCSKGYPKSMIMGSNDFILYSKQGGSNIEKGGARVIRKEVYPEMVKVLNGFSI